MPDSRPSGPSSLASAESADSDIHMETVASCLAPFVVMGSLVLTAMLVLSYLGRYSFIADIVCNFRAQIVAAMLPFPFLLWSFRRHRLAVVAGAICLIAAMSILSVYLPAAKTAPGKQRIKILSFNVLGVNDQHEDVCEVVKSENPDVMIVIEYSGEWPNVFKRFKNEYPYHVLQPRWHGFGIAVFSKYPISDEKSYQLTGDITDVPAIFANVNTDRATFRIAAVHLFSPTNAFRAKIRNEQLAELTQILGESKHTLPVAVIGDFNAAPWTSCIRNFLDETNLRDSRQGFGLHASWPTFAPLASVPIDHAFLSEEFHVHDRYLSESAGSDHRSMVIELSIPEE